MLFNSPLIEGVLIKRYKRFLADVSLQDGSVITAHSANTGSMKGCSEPGSRVWLRDSKNPQRKYPLSWELVEAKPNVIVGINTGLPNQLVKEAIETGKIKELSKYQTIQKEVSYGNEHSRIDLLLKDGTQKDAYVEVKNVTMAINNIAYFPDAVSTRGQKHLRELALMVQQGYRGVLVYCVQRNDVNEVRPADMIDPEYGDLLRQVSKQGVEMIAYQANISFQGIYLERSLPVVLS